MSGSTDWDAVPHVHGNPFSYVLKGVRTIWVLTGVEHPRLTLAIAVLVLGQMLGFGLPLIFKALVEHFPRIVREGITPYAMWLLISLIAVQALTLVLRRFVQEPVFVRALIRLENYWPRIAQEKLLALSIGYHERENTGKKIAKVQKGVDKLVGMLGDIFWQLLPALAGILINAVIVLVMDWRLGLIFLLPLIPAAWIHLKSIERFRPTWEQWETKKEESVGYFCQSILNVRTVQSYVAEGREAARHTNVRKEMQELDLSAVLLMQRYYFAMETLLGLALISTIGFGLYFCHLGWSTLGTVAYITVTGAATNEQLWSIVQVYSRMMRDLIAAERLQALLAEEPDVKNYAAGSIPPEVTGALELVGVTLLHPGKTEPLFKGFDLRIEPGEMLALVGKSGAGKTSFVSLLLRILDPTHGMVVLDGVDIRRYDRDWYRSRFAYVPQEVEIFDGSILQNIIYAYPHASEDHIAKSIEAACLFDALTDTRRFPDGVFTEVGERGVRLSGGERQRVGIARAYVALLSGAQVLVLDEATSSLDSESEQVVQRFIGKLREERTITIVAIAHRLSTIQQADRICVLESGKIGEMGTHEQLLRRNGLYQKLVALQQLGELSE